MSDTKLRDLERRWRETGTVDDEAAYLLERVRVGDLTRERLDLAAYLGHRACRAVCTPRAASFWDRVGSHGVDPYFTQLDTWGGETRDRSNCALAHALLPFWVRQYPGEQWLVQALRDEERRTRLRVDREDDDRRPLKRGLEERAIQFAPMRSTPGFPKIEPLASLSLHTISCAISGASVGLVAFNVAAFASIPHGRGWARRTIRLEVVPWALGYGDPLQIRASPASGSRRSST